MKLLPIIINDNKEKKPNFKSVEHFDYIKKMNGMICAVCGKKTLSTDLFVSANTPNCKPLIYNIQKNALKHIEKTYPKVWDTLIKFTQNFPKLSLDKILEDSKNYVELKLAVSKEIYGDNFSFEKNSTRVDRTIGRIFFDMLEDARTHLEIASIVMKNLESIKTYLSEEQQKAFDLLKLYSEKYPQKTLSEIINTEEVYKFHTEQDRNNRIDLYNKMHFHLDNITEMIENENPKAASSLLGKKLGTFNIFRSDNDSNARIVKTKEAYQSVLSEYNCEHLSEKVFDEIDKLPQKFMTADTFFAYAHKHNLNDGQIISQLFTPNFATEKFLNTVADGGSDRIENKLVMHKACNHMCNRTTYPRFIQYHPDMPKHVQTQVNMVSEAILNDELPSFIDFYPLKMPINLANKSDNLIKIDITDFCQRGIKHSLKKEEALNEELQNLYKLQDEKTIQKIQGNKNSNIDAELRDLRYKILSTKESIKIEGKKRFRMQEYLKSQGVQ